MKNLIIIFSLFVVSLSYGTNNLDCKEENQAIDLCNKIESNFLKTKINKVLSCEGVESSTTVTNSDGSITTTTTTTITCDTPQELVLVNAVMAVLLQ